MRRIQLVFGRILVGMMIMISGCAPGSFTGFVGPSQVIVDGGGTENFAEFSGTQIAGPPPEGTFNLQIQALEVTQGVRGDIPTRVSPGGGLSIHDASFLIVSKTRLRVPISLSVTKVTTMPALS